MNFYLNQIQKFILIGFFLLGKSVKSQNINPISDFLYLEEEITEIRVRIKEEDNLLLHAEENRYIDIYVEAEVTFSNSKLDQVTVDGAGIRLRGNTGRSYDKRSYKIDFRQFGGEKFRSYKKLNLKPNVVDPSHIRELVSMHLYRLMNIPSQRVAPSILYINDDYKGVYLNVEQIDDEFIDKRYGSEEGFLYKCSQGMSLAYKEEVYDDKKITSKMNESADDRNELSHFINILNNTSDETFKEEIEKIFDVNSFIRQMAVEAIIGHWDGYSWFNNNYYLFYNPNNLKFEFIPYDCDNTFGVDFTSNDWGNRNLNHFYDYNKKRPLVTRILNVEVYKNSYYRYLNILFEEYFTENYLFPKFNFFRDLLKTHVQNDTYFSGTFGFSYQDFINAFEYESKKPATYGLKEYLETRRQSGINQLPKNMYSLIKLNPKTYNLAEKMPSGYLVGAIIDGETLPYTYSIIYGNESNAFSLDKIYGILSVSNSAALDFEISPIFTLIIEASDGYWTDTTTVTINLIDIDEDILSLANPSQMVYPNPSSGLINIRMADLKEFTIYNLSGKMLLKSNENPVNISELRQGAYIMKLTNNKGKLYSTNIIKK